MLLDGHQRAAEHPGLSFKHRCAVGLLAVDAFHCFGEARFFDVVQDRRAEGVAPCLSCYAGELCEGGRLGFANLEFGADTAQCTCFQRVQIRSCIREKQKP